VKAFRWSDNYLAWAAIEIAAMSFSSWGMFCLVRAAGVEVVGRSIAPATILLSVAVAVVIQLWVKLNELSALSSLTSAERTKLRDNVQRRVRALVWLVVFFVSFIFCILVASILSAAGHDYAEPTLWGIGAGCGASLVLIAGVLVDLNEIALFRWTVEMTEHDQRRRDTQLAALSNDEPGFEQDAHIQGYKRVSNER
jgi:uncharacterized membrane protein